ncbi:MULTISPECIES: VPS10 domain-containing protein [unclassified Tenacibaculum]|uniref:VPS10 domain-containing protein n=1 Tax=unclassified Tenacibaculum TaxID=2635139 RepID=UPI001F492A6C|nr:MULTISPECIES: glycosyl hydrolase [unclassified Tenacibaculum]MCF2874942.1 glycosyl hydrolase [Tenacibaculum sp. Cn5-1]MCF2933992.1 glycosyl hydrolase [Tenacibaculum sp. Cn5-34]MCG7510202.1 glycosyl hydrolase [Tenacibaculum sp. Cn5-46]
MMKTICKVFIALVPYALVAQQATTSKKIKESLVQKESLAKTSIVKNVSFENIGPTVMSGRVVDIDVNPENTTEFYVGYASGGLWYTNNNGTTFTPVLDNSPTQNVGDIAVDWKNGTLWVGTGENNSSRSSYAGIGILKSTDKGKTWENVGLHDSHHIGRILINPNNPDEVIIGAIGHLYSSNKERGIFKTTDGGKTWKKTLFINKNTGIIDVQQAPNNFNVLYAAAWERNRKAWNFDGDGKNSAIYKSTDAGSTWKKISDNNGFPNGKSVGRIGLAVFNEDVVYAFHDSQFRRKKEKKDDEDSNALTKDDFKTMPVEDFLKLKDKKLNTYLKMNGFQEKYRAENVKQMVRSGSVKPNDLAKYLENANTLLFDTPVIGAEVFKTTNGGKTWKKTHEGYLDDLYYSYGYYFGEIRVDPQDEKGIYVLGVPILKSKDGGKTFTSISKENVHADHQALWVNAKKQGHLIDGNDGGLNISYDDGESWTKLNQPAVGQFYTVYADNQKNYKVYGGLQDNGVWVASHNAKIDKRWKQTGKNPYESIMGGDGMQVAVDDRNPNIVYTGYQFGNYYRINRKTGQQKYIQPKHKLGENPYRFNWQTPIQLSKHNQDILYLGGNKLHRSLDKGDTWETISEDLTKGGRKGNVAYGTLTSISESPFQFGLIYIGTDDGYIQLTKNGGGSWENISNTLPQNLWVSRVIASKHKKERVYVTLNGYRWDDFNVYVYMSDDYGKTWKNISGNIPASPVNVIKEDPKKENILYVGTDNGLYVSFNKGAEWQLFQKGLPNVAVHDLVIQPKAKHLIVGTHGRSLYKANIAPLQDFKNEETLFAVKKIRKSNFWGSSWSKWLKPNTPKISIPFYVKENKKVSIKIYADDILINTIEKNVEKGFNEVTYDASFSDEGRKEYLKKHKDAIVKKAKNGVYYLPKGKYTIKFEDKKQTLEIR